MSNMVLPSTGVLVIPGVGVVLTIGQHTILITITTPARWVRRFTAIRSTAARR
jgi:hypothetical protein